MANGPSVVDLFSGVGGLSLGTVKAGYTLKGVVEYEKRILDSHLKNFPNTPHLCADVSTLDAKHLRKTFRLGSSELGGLIGGPPCQGFSSMGKRNIADSRNHLFVSFFRLVAEMQPGFFLAENVPGILGDQYKELRNSASSLVEEKYNILAPLKIAANDFGAPTSRTRIFFLGVRKDIGGAENLPKVIESMKSATSVNVHDALQGLPIKISEDWLDYNSSWKKIEFALNSNYATNLNRIVEAIGDKISIKRFLKNNEVSCCFGTRHSEDILIRYRLLKPGQKDKISRSIKLRPDGFCPTLRAGTDNSRGSYQAVRPIHPSEPRVITPREAARLQGFPDWFQFHETKWHSFRQIGNSVCPIAAEKVLGAIKTTLKM